MTFITQASYTSEAWANLVKNPENREAATRALVEKVGGRLIAYYYCFGEHDTITIYEAPDETVAAGAILASIGAGHVKACKTTVLFTMEQAMEAMRKAGTISFSGPKG